MPILFSIDPSGRFLLTRFVGRITDDELLLAYRDLYAGPEGYTPRHELTDLSEADVTELSGEGIQDLANFSGEIMKKHQVSLVKSAIYAPDDLKFGMSRMYGMLVEQSPESVRVFRDRAEAERWLEEP